MVKLTSRDKRITQLHGLHVTNIALRELETTRCYCEQKDRFIFQRAVLGAQQFTQRNKKKKKKEQCV